MCGGAVLQAQTPTDAIMMKKREVCAALIYDHGTWDEYWEGPTLRGNENIGTLTRNTVMPMIAFGILDNLNVIVSTPYVKTESSGGQLAGVEGFQDFGIVVKYQAFQKKLGPGNLSFIPVLGFATPMTNYLSDYLPYSLGMGTTELTGRGILQYEMDNGFYLRASYAYLWRGQTKAERDYYYADGSYYTPWMDVPNANNAQAALGKWFFQKALRVEGSYTILNCTDGDDIRKYNSPQPTNKVEVSQVSGYAQYYPIKKLRGLGFVGYWSQMVDGRNMGKFTNYGIGATYLFKI